MRAFPSALLSLLLAACGSPTGTTKEVPDLAVRVAKASGVDAYRRIEGLRFTWKHASGRARSYDWRPRAGRVVVRADGVEEEISSGALPEDATEQQRTLHQAWVNDGYWLLFPLMILDDGSKLADGGRAMVPGFDALGETRVLEVAYPPEEGYTGGDAYVLYVGEDDLPVAWSFTRRGTTEPAFVCTRGGIARTGGLALPTRFEDAEGKAMIEITDLRAD